MKKLLLFLCTLYSLLSTTSAQQGEWTWMKGSSAQNGGAVYGTLGVGDPLNTPPALYGGAACTGKDGKLWLFGGYNNNSHSTLWVYDPATNNWTWMNGPTATNQYGEYGTKGIPDPANFPGGRAFGFFSWTDTSGNLWIYGGNGYGGNGQGTLSDLWKYDVITNEWTWMHGHKSVGHTPNYGTKGVSDPNNHPGGRSESTCSWTDKQNRLWFFGGFDYNYSGRDDVWMYDISINEWTWMGGSNNAAVPPNWGTQGVFSATNTPGGRNSYSAWKDSSDHLWMFGGGINAGAIYADLWEYDIALGQWAWISGDDAPSNNGHHGQKCDASVYYPKSRTENRAAWTDACNNFWIYGGSNYDYNGTDGMNDLWVYLTSQNQWIWVSGDSTFNPPATWGTQGISSPTNKPFSRTGGPSWIDQDGNLWLFGGSYQTWTSWYNDLWRYVPDTACYGCNPALNPPITSFIASDTTLCEKFCINYFDSSQNNPIAWEWIFEGGDPATSALQNPVNICYDNPGVFDVTLITTSSGGSVDTLTLADYITVYTNPFAPVITQSGNILTSSPADFYQWYLNGAIIPGATGQSYEITESGLYTVVIEDTNGCSAQSDIKATYVGISDVTENFFVNVFSNPSSDLITVEGYVEGLNEVNLRLVNVLGQMIMERKLFLSNQFTTELDVSILESGMYFLEFRNNDHAFTSKILVQ